MPIEQPKLEVQEADVEALVPYANNAKIHDEEQVAAIVESIKEFGYCDPIAAWHRPDGTTEIIEGHGRVMALKKLGVEKAPVIYLDHLTDEERRAYAHVHNQTTLNSDFDYEILLPDLEELSEALDIDFDEFGFQLGEDDLDEFDPTYTQNVGQVIYEPKDTNHKPEDLYSIDMERFNDLIEAVEDESIKEMLRIRAAWFCDFSYSRIADYYAYQATGDEQRAFEALGLVLLDRDQMIENGFADIVDSI